MLTIAMESKEKPPQDLATPPLSGIYSEKKNHSTHVLPKACWHRVYNSHSIAKKKIIHPEMNNKIHVLCILNGI